MRASGLEGRIGGLVDLLFSTARRFLQGEVFKGGFLNGLPGYHIAWVNAFIVARCRTKLRAVDEGFESLPHPAPRTPRQPGPAVSSRLAEVSCLVLPSSRT